MPGIPSRTSPTRFAYLGPEGTFAEAALLSAVSSSEGTRYPQPSVPAALAAVRSGDADAALVPMENSVEGSVPATMDGLADGDPLVITREVFLDVAFVLAVRPGTTLSDVGSVVSHPHALAQTAGRLADLFPDIVPLPTSSTAGAAEDVAAGKYDAAVCALIAAERYGLVPLVVDLADRPGAVTRFVLVRPPGEPTAPTGNDKTSLVAVVGDRTGALLELLSEFAVRGISLTRIESRPTRERLGVYSFSLDCEGHIADRRVGEALAALHRVCDDVRFLGSYPRADGRENKPVPDGGRGRGVRRGRGLAGGHPHRPPVSPQRDWAVEVAAADVSSRVGDLSCALGPPLGKPAGPPDLVADQVDGGRHQQRADDEGVEQDAEADQERELAEQHEREDGEGAEGRGQHQPGAGDHAAGDRQRAQDAVLRAVDRGLLAGPGHQEDVVVDPQRDEEHEPDQQDAGVAAGEAEARSRTPARPRRPSRRRSGRRSPPAAAAPRSSAAAGRARCVMTSSTLGDDHPQVAGAGLAGVEVAGRRPAHERRRGPRR